MKETVRFKVYEKGVYGINNPTVFFVLNSQQLDGDYIVKADHKEVPFHLKSIQIEEKISIEACVGQAHVVELYYKYKGKEYLICQTKSTKAIRIKNKIKSIFKNNGRKTVNIFKVVCRGIIVAWRDYHFLVPISEWKKYLKKAKNRLHSEQVVYYANPFDEQDYRRWLKKHETVDYSEELEYQPLISILIPTYNISKDLLSQCLDSVLNQHYQNFEICIADDHSTNLETIETLKQYEKKDSRIKVVYRQENGHISNATNSALEIAQGEFIGLLDNDDLLAENALYEVVKELNHDRTIDMLYSDEDKLDLNGKRCLPNLKPDFSPDTLLSLNYICHFTVIKTSLVKEVGGFEVGLEGAQDYDLFLKVTEKAQNIKHIAKILYHWRMIPGSTSMDIDNKGYAMDKGRIALENALKRRNIKGVVHKDEVSTYYHIEYTLEQEPLVSIIIPTKDYPDVTRTCLESVFGITDYTNYEVLLVDNNSEEEETFKLFEEFKNKYNNFKVIEAKIPFNYSKINNLAVKQAQGDVLVLLNNDTEIISPNWLKTMVGYAMQEHIGAVGAKLLYPDETVQHAGVLIGLGGVASHAYTGEIRAELGFNGKLRVPQNYAAVTAACLAVEKKKFLEVGGLEEDLTVAYNDVDFNLKLLDKGYYNVILPQIELFHFESKSRGLDTEGEKYKRFMKEEAYMHDKWKKYMDYDPFYNPNFSKKYWFVFDKD
ncbi:glycosyltransferase [Faecalibacillus faecis]|uniref:glycosyltransferase family 2 protein n=1 Tax=Faecalibacillus faecis TaxID=1982628 RepID=UPI00386DDC13